jgi:hypothetical protein
VIEVVGFRYAVGPPPARSVRRLVRVTGLGYVLYLTQAILALGGWPAEIVMTTSYLFLIVQTTAIVVAFRVCMKIVDADKQRVALPSPATGVDRRIRQWWSSSEAAAWLRLTPIWLGAAVFGTMASIPFVKHCLGEIAYGAAVSVAAVLMACHLRAGRGLTQRITETSLLGNADLYWNFDLDRFDCSDEGRFRARFGFHKHWKPPGSITHPAEADRYADRARQQRFMFMAVTAVSALMALVFAQRILSTVVLTTWHDLTHLLDKPHEPDLGIAHLSSLAASILLFLLPVGFQYGASEIGALAKLYEERAESLLDE